MAIPSGRVQQRHGHNQIGTTVVDMLELGPKWISVWAVKVSVSAYIIQASERGGSLDHRVRSQLSFAEQIRLILAQLVWPRWSGGRLK